MPTMDGAGGAPRWSAPIACCARRWPISMTASTRKANTTSRRCSRPSPSTSFMELGRSCVLKPYRNKRTLELLWQGVWTYVREHGADVMIGCASFEGTDPSIHAEALSFLHHNALAPEDWRVRAHDHLRVDMNMMPREAINTRAALKGAPAADQGLFAGRRLCRRRRGDRSPVRHDRRVHHHAGRGDQVALLRAFRRSPTSSPPRFAPSSRR